MPKKERKEERKEGREDKEGREERKDNQLSCVLKNYRAYFQQLRKWHTGVQQISFICFSICDVSIFRKMALSEIYFFQKIQTLWSDFKNEHMK